MSDERASFEALLFSFEKQQTTKEENVMQDLLWILIVATSIWVLVDAKTIGVKKGQIQGVGNMGPWGWFFVCLLLWIVGFPFYLAKRPEYKRVNGK